MSKEKQKKFLDVLFTKEVGGDLDKAKLAAGYSESTSTKDVVDALSDRLLKLTKEFIAHSGTKSAYTMYDIMKGTESLIGSKDRMAAAKDLLDRGGFVKTDKVEVSGPDVLFILPRKDAE